MRKDTTGRRRSALMVAVIAAAACGSSAYAVDWYWDSDTTTAGRSDTGGNNIYWSTNASYPYWVKSEAANQTNVAWSSTTAARAVFGDWHSTGPFVGLITLNSSVTSSGMWFKRDGYRIAGPSYVTLTGSGPSITVDPGLAATISAELRGTSGLVKDGSGMLTLNGACPQLTGTIDIQAGTMALGSFSDRISDLAYVSISGGTLAMGANNDTVAGVQLNAGSITGTGMLTSNSAFDVRSGTIGAVLAGGTASVGLTKTTSGTVTLSGANSYSGDTKVQEGTLALGSAGGIGSSSRVYVSGGSLDVASSDSTVAAVQLTNGATITGSTGSLASSSTFDVQSGTVSAKLRGSLGLTKSTAGTVTLSGANEYTGDTAVRGGTLLVRGSIAAASKVTIESGAKLGGAGGQVYGTVIVRDGGAIAPGEDAKVPAVLNLGDTTFGDGTGSIAQLNIDITRAGSPVASDGTNANDVNAGYYWDVAAMNSFTRTGSFVVNLSGAPSGLVGDTKRRNVTYKWLIASVKTGGFDLGPGGIAAHVSLAGFSPVSRLVSSAATLETSGTKLWVVYTYSSVPEATTLLLGSAGMALILTQRRSRHTGRRGRISVM